MKPRLVFAHGWGFHGGVWSDIAVHFDDYEVSYWGREYVRGGPVLSPGIPEGAVVVAYSFGVAQVLAASGQHSKLGGLVSICGFDSLCARGRESAILDLASGLSRNPHAQMRAFWATCGVNRFAGSEVCDVAELEQGLQDMLQLDAVAQLDALSCPVLALASVDDRVVPVELSRAVWEQRGLVITESGGHGLPITRAQLCVEQTKRFLKFDVP